jgi:hypothetical protein
MWPANRQRRMEGAKIKKSLVSLKESIRALGRKSVLFWASKLTWVFQDSNGERSKTHTIAMISPDMNLCEHSLQSMWYAHHRKEHWSTNKQQRHGRNPKWKWYKKPFLGMNVTSTGTSIHRFDSSSSSAFVGLSKDMILKSHFWSTKIFCCLHVKKSFQ